MLGEMLLEQKQPVQALAAFEESQRADPNRLRNVYGAAHAAALAGDKKKARMYYARLLTQVGPNAADRAEIKEAKAFATKGDSSRR
jgi:cytochrome c-type biogenesis protein CcmH/NrfG